MRVLDVVVGWHREVPKVVYLGCMGTLVLGG